MDIQKLFQKYQSVRLLKFFSPVHPLIISLLIFVVASLVYVTGGIKFVYSHSMYVPIIYGAAIYGLTGGVLTGFVGGLVLGPFMPIDTTTGELQNVFNWSYRTGLFCLIGGAAGLAIDSLKHQLFKLQQSSFYDASSGLPNRNSLCRDIDLMARNHPTGQFALTLCSIENFLQVANTFGPEVSDSLLPQVFSRLKTFPQLQSICATQKDGVGFLVANVDEMEAARLAEEILDAMVPSFMVEDVPIYCDFCSGMAHYRHPGEGTLLQKANLALYQAHERNQRLVCFDTSIQVVPKENLSLLGEISFALNDNQFQLYYQPKIDLCTRNVFGLEALIRWNHPTLGLIPPFKFINQAENTGLIQPITLWVIKTGLAQLAQWRQEGLDISLAINISARNLTDGALYHFIENQLALHGIPADKIELELTESALMTDFEQALGYLSEMKKLGLRLAVDDFGTGHSSLAYLKRLPVNSLKIDQTFVRDIAQNSSDQEIAKTIIDLASTLSIQSVAEGVEDEKTYSLLVKMGCNSAQGYHFSKPMPAEDVFGWITRWQAENTFLTKSQKNSQSCLRLK